MSKAFFKGSVKPHQLANFSFQQIIKKNNKKQSIIKSVQVWTTPCIVQQFGKNQNETLCTVLINPSNPQLSGVSNFPYFPRGGPVPSLKPKSMHKDWQPLGYVTNWGGMDVGDGMLYPVSVVDGLVHQLGGRKLAMECKLKYYMTGGCPVGTSVETSPGNEKLQQCYDRIIHSTPPFFKHNGDEDPILSLRKCYRSAFDLAFGNDVSVRNSSLHDDDIIDVVKVACPLLGAGCRGVPVDIAIDIAVNESWKWLRRSVHKDVGYNQVVAFGIPDKEIASSVVNEFNLLEEKVKQSTTTSSPL